LWQALGEAALAQGNIQIVELAYQKLKNFEKLSFLYLITGDSAKLGRMGKIAEHRADYGSEFQNSLWTGNVESRIRVFKEMDLCFLCLFDCANIDPLAYATAKTYGLTEECAAILEATGLTEEDITLPKSESHLPDPPQAISPMQSNWPILPSSRSLLEKALTDELGDLTLEEPSANGYADDLTAFEKGLNGTQEPSLINIAEDGEGWEEVGEAGGESWDIGGEEDEVADEMGVEEVPAEGGVSDAEYWVRNSPLAADHIAAGSFDSAMQLLNRQVGAVNFEPLKPKFMQIYQASRTFLAANPGLPPVELFVRRDHGDKSRSLPRLPWDYEKIKGVQMRDALKLVTANKVEEAIVALREILCTLLLFAVSNKAEADDVAKTIETIREYIVALSVEVARRGLDVSTPEGVKRNLELAAYFTNFQLTSQHRGLAYQQAMAQFNKYKNIATAGVFAQKYVALGIGKPDAVDRVRSWCVSLANILGKEDYCVGPAQYARHH
jgi:coatomer protein complex subunit alpha (xenin)